MYHPGTHNDFLDYIFLKTSENTPAKPYYSLYLVLAKYELLFKTDSQYIKAKFKVRSNGTIETIWVVTTLNFRYKQLFTTTKFTHTQSDNWRGNFKNWTSITLMSAIYFEMSKKIGWIAALLDNWIDGYIWDKTSIVKC